MSLPVLLLVETVLLLAGLGIVKVRYATDTAERLGGYVVVTVTWTLLQAVGFSGLYYGGWGH